MSMTQPLSGMRILYLSHGGGPIPLLGGEGHEEMIACLETVKGRMARPSAIVVVSAHWEETVATVTSGARPELLYDYYGFPEPAYEIAYPAPGAPELAQAVQTLLSEGGVEAVADAERGFDHGLFVPLKLMYPEADIPCIQLSLKRGLDPEAHIRMGETLTGASGRGGLSGVAETFGGNILLLGSGFSFHNMRAFFEAPTQETRAMNEAFENWLVETCSSTDLPEAERRQRLAHWDAAPSARYCHPREEHLMPLQVCYGAAQRPCTEVFRLQIIGRQASFHLW